MSAYQEFTGKTVEEALRNAREAFSVGLDDLDFEIMTPGSRGVLGMGAEPARIVAAPRNALGGAAPKREAAASAPLPPPTHEDRPPRQDDRPPRRDDRPPRRDAERSQAPADRPPRPDDRPPRRDDRPPRRDDRPRRPSSGDLTERDRAELAAARGSVASERAELDAAEASPRRSRPGRRSSRS